MKKITALVDLKLVVSIALGILLAGVLAWAIGFFAHSLGFKHKYMGKDMMHKKMMDRGMNDMGGGAAGTFMEGTPVPEGVDPSAM